eukprot:318712-Rhodomonas_salina.2
MDGGVLERGALRVGLFDGAYRIQHEFQTCKSKPTVFFAASVLCAEKNASDLEGVGQLLLDALHNRLAGLLVRHACKNWELANESQFTSFNLVFDKTVASIGNALTFVNKCQSAPAKVSVPAW